MEKKTLAENVFYNMLYQVIVTVLPIVTTPYTARVLGLRANGIHSFTESIVTYFIIFGALGTSLYGIRKVAYVRDDKEKLSHTTIEIIFLKIILMVASLGIYIPALCISSEYAYVYRIHIINIVANGLDISWFYQGVEDFKRVTIRNLLVKFVFVISLFLFVRQPSDLPKYILFIVVSTLLGNLLMIYYLPQYINIKRGNFHPLSHIKSCLMLFIPQAMNYVYALLDRSMLGWMTHTDNVSIYDQAQRLVRMVTAILQSVGYVMMARVANMTATNDKEGIIHYVHKSINFNMFLALPAMFGIVGVADDFIPFFLGKEYVAVIPVLQILSILILTMSLNSILGVQMLMPMGKENIYAIATTAGAVANVIINIILIPNIGIMGACVSSIVAEIIVFIISYWDLKSMFDVRRIVKDNMFVVLASLVMFFVVRMISKIELTLFLKILIELISGGCVYITIMWLTRNEIFLIIYNKVFNYIKKMCAKLKMK